VEYLKDSTMGRVVAAQIAAHGFAVHLPHLSSIEAASAFRSLVHRSLMTPERARAALDDLDDFAAVRHAHEPHLRRVWELRGSLSAYDAIYVALAEALSAMLLTCDARLAQAQIPGLTIGLVTAENSE
jgi:predicted nucleic acid-binding protein